MRPLDFTTLSDPIDLGSVSPDDLDPTIAQETRSTFGCSLLAYGVVILGGGALLAQVHLGFLIGAGVLFVAVVAMLTFASGMSDDVQTERIVRLSRFAAANGMRFEGQLKDQVRPGTIFADGTDRVTRDQVVLTEPREITLGRHSCASGQVSATRLKYWSFASTPLAGGHALPHLYLEAKAVDRRTRPSPAVVDERLPERLPLDGPGGEAYVVRGPLADPDAVHALLERSVFTPDVLATMTERPVDVEVVDGHLLLMARETVGTQPETWSWIIALTVAVAESLEAAAG